MIIEFFQKGTSTMEKYLKPEIEIIKFQMTDIISTSGGDDDDTDEDIVLPHR